MRFRVCSCTNACVCLCMLVCLCMCTVFSFIRIVQKSDSRHAYPSKTSKRTQVTSRSCAWSPQLLCLPSDKKPDPGRIITRLIFAEVGSATFDLLCVFGARCASGKSVRSTPSRRGTNQMARQVAHAMQSGLVRLTF